ncbi:MAG: hypothetical protein HY403_11530 [Elusimicrobia bacterium]|nr:hypothetical protein [Elusimicrobiota bacterium]
MIKLLIASCFAVPASAAVPAPLEAMRAIALEIGVTAPIDAPLPAAPATAMPVRSPRHSVAVSGTANLFARGRLSCDSWSAETGRMHGKVTVFGDVTIFWKDVHAQFRIEGLALVEGTCSEGAGWVEGEAILSGTGDAVIVNTSPSVSGGTMIVNTKVKIRVQARAAYVDAILAPETGLPATFHPIDF